MDTPTAPAVPPADPASAATAPPIAETGIGRIPLWLQFALLAAGVIVLWLVAFDNGQASAMVDTTGTALHELFHDARHLSGAPCH